LRVRSELEGPLDPRLYEDETLVHNLYHKDRTPIMSWK